MVTPGALVGQQLPRPRRKFYHIFSLKMPKSTKTPITKIAAKIAIFIVDDHPLVVEVLVELLNASDDFIVVGSACDGKSAMESIEKNEGPIDILILDLHLPGTSGLELLKSLEHQKRVRQVVVLSGITAKESIISTFALGAKAYIEKTADVQSLMKTLRAVARGEAPMNDHVSDVLRSAIKARESAKTLSSRDIMILRYLSLNYSIKTIAQTVGLTIGAVYKAKNRVEERTNMKPGDDFFKVATRLGIDVSRGSESAPLPSKTENRKTQSNRS